MKNLSFLAFFILLPMKVLALELKVGDILLQPLNCWSCMLIEAQEKSIYSHMGLVIETTPSVKVIESLGVVRKVDLRDFDSRTKKDQKLAVLRFKDQQINQYLSEHQNHLLHVFETKVRGLPFDSAFLWDNFDESGAEKLYCSEMITKLLVDILKIELPLKRMKYDINRELWIQHFRGLPPDGKWGNAPADFEKSPLFFKVGEL